MSGSVHSAVCWKSTRSRGTGQESAHNYQSKEAKIVNSESTEQIKVLIAEDQEYLREGIRKILSEQPNIQVVGTAGDGLAALQMAWDLEPNLLLLAIHMP